MTNSQSRSDSARRHRGETALQLTWISFLRARVAAKDGFPAETDGKNTSSCSGSSASPRLGDQLATRYFGTCLFRVSEACDLHPDVVRGAAADGEDLSG